MLQGVDVSKYYKTPVEPIILQHYFQEEAKKNLQFTLIMQSVLLDRSSQEEVSKFNLLMKEYSDLINPANVKARKDFTKKAEDMLKKIGKIKYKGTKPVDITKKTSSLTLQSNFDKKGK